MKEAKSEPDIVPVGEMVLLVDHEAQAKSLGIEPDLFRKFLSSVRLPIVWFNEVGFINAVCLAEVLDELLKPGGTGFWTKETAGRPPDGIPTKLTERDASKLHKMGKNVRERVLKRLNGLLASSRKPTKAKASKPRKEPDEPKVDEEPPEDEFDTSMQEPDVSDAIERVGAVVDLFDGGFGDDASLYEDDNGDETNEAEIEDSEEEDSGEEDEDADREDSAYGDTRGHRPPTGDVGRGLCEVD